MEKVVFMTLLPDDYHGMPEVGDFSDVYFALPPDEETVFRAWSAAGYNSWNMGDGEGSEEEVFQEYGNGESYYATYVIITNATNIDDLRENVNDKIESISYDGVPPEIDEVCEAIKQVPGVVNVIAIEANV
jgi:hypothetical protein